MWDIRSKEKMNIKKSIFFVCIFGVINIGILKIISAPIGVDWANQTGMEECRKYRNQYDVCFMGTSRVITNISNQEIFNEYGITSVSVGEPEQPLYLTYYTMEEMFRHQNPKVVFVESQAIFYTDEHVKNRILEEEDHIVHKSIDCIFDMKIKQQAIKETEKYADEIDCWSYYSKWYREHNNWKNISDMNFKDVDSAQCMNGNVVSFMTMQENNIRSLYFDTTEIEEISDENEEWINKMVNLCAENDAQLVFLTASTNWNTLRYNAMQQLAEKYGREYIDINVTGGKCEIKSIDTMDVTHFNLSGAIKVSHYIGEYLVNNYEFEDRRIDKKYKRIVKQNEVFEKQKKIMNTKMDLINTNTFEEYLSMLTQIDKMDNIICISIYDEGTNCLTEKENQLLYALGLQTDLLGQYRSSYSAVISEQGIWEEFSPDETVVIECEIEGNELFVQSDGLESGGMHSIKINNVNYSQGERGFNIVVYNTEINQVISSVYFDTYECENPFVKKKNTEKITYIEIDDNIWQKEE